MYFPGPGYCDRLKYDIEEQFYRLNPIVNPYLGFLLNYDCMLYLSGDGEKLLLNKFTNTFRFPPCCHTQKKGTFCPASILSRKSES